MLGRLLDLLPNGRLAQGALLVMFWQAIRLSALALWVVIAARALGTDAYGYFAGVAGLATAISGFSGWGVGYLMYQRTSIDHRLFGTYWSKTLLAYCSSSIGLALVFLAAAYWMFPQAGLHLLLLILLSEVVAYPIIAATAVAFAAHERMGWSAALPALGGLFRLVALATYAWLLGGRDIGAYLVWHTLASILAACASLVAVQRLLDPTPTSDRLSWKDLRESSAFCMVWFTNGAIASWDKALVLRLAGGEISGLYAAAYRFAALAAMPVDSLIMAAMPRLFRRGSGDSGDPRLLRYVCLAVAGYGMVAAVALAVFAPVLGWVLGPGFTGAIDVARGAALMIPLYGLRQLGGQILVTHDQRKARGGIDVAALVLMTILASLLVPAYGVTGAVLMIVMTESALVAMTWVAVMKHVLGRSNVRSDI